MPQLEQIATFPSQIFWLVVTFIALLLIMWRIAVPKISDSLEARQKRMDDNLARAEEVKKEAEAAMEAYETSLANARSEAHSMLTEAAAKLADEAQAREAELAKAMQKRVAESEANINAALEAAIGNIREMATDVAISATERLAGDAPVANDVDAAVDAALKARG